MGRSKFAGVAGATNFQVSPAFGKSVPALLRRAQSRLSRQECRSTVAHFWRCTLYSYKSKKADAFEFLTRADGDNEEVDGD